MQSRRGDGFASISTAALLKPYVWPDSYANARSFFPCSPITFFIMSMSASIAFVSGTAFSYLCHRLQVHPFSAYPLSPFLCLLPYKS